MGPRIGAPSGADAVAPQGRRHGEHGDVAAWFGSVPVVPAACTNNELLGAEGCKTNGIDNFDKIKFWRTPEAKCATQNDACVPYSRWATDYVAVMGGR